MHVRRFLFRAVIKYSIGDGMIKRATGLAVITLIAIFSRVACAGAADPADWTIMFYMDADNNLEGWAINDFYELADVGSTADVNVVVQLDRAVGYTETDGNWTDCKRFYVTLGMTPTPENAIASLGEINMGDPQTLQDFAVWAIGQYPADKYALILGSHGWLTVVGADSSHAYDWLSSTEIRTTLQQVTTATGIHMDVISFDSCMGASIEMAYQISDRVEVMVASEEVTSSLYGYPYDVILAELVAFPTMNATEFAMVIHDQYVLVNEGRGDEFLTHSVLNTTRIADEVVPAVNSLATNLNRLLPVYCHDVLNTIHEAATGFTNPSWRDIYDFCQILAANIPDTETADAAQNVVNVLLNVFLAEWHDRNSPDLHGLSIYLPPDDDPDYYVTWYRMSAFQWTTDTVWEEFLEALFETYYPGTLARESFSEVLYSLLDSDFDDYLDTIHVRVNAATTGSTCGVALFGQLINSSGSVVAMDNASWTITGSNGGWGDLYLSVPPGSDEDWYDVALLLYDDYGILEDRYSSLNYTSLPQPMQHDVSVTGLSSRVRIVGQGFPAEITVSIGNPGHYAETVNVTTSVNGTSIDTTQLILPAGNTTSFTIQWETDGETLGNYTITSYVEPVDGEVNTDDNTLTGSSILVTIPGDVDGNRDVNIFDIVRMAGVYGTHSPDPEYEPNCDIDGDGDIDIFDIVIAAGNYGESW
jgi:hypothetical protein